MKRIYISVPIDGDNYTDQRTHVFMLGTRLRNLDHDPISPYDIIPRVTIPYCASMGKRIETLLGCDVIYLCKGWSESKECRAELEVALVYGKEIITE